MAGVIKFRYEQHPGMGYLSQKLATSLGGKEQSPGPQSLGKNLPKSRPNPDGLCFKTTFFPFQRSDGKIETATENHPEDCITGPEGKISRIWEMWARIQPVLHLKNGESNFLWNRCEN